MKSEKYYSEILLLKTITPIFVGTAQGTELSPYSDFIQSADKILLIDEKKLEHAFSEKPELVGEFVTSIRSSMDKSKTRAEFELKEFLENNFGNIEQFQKYTIPCDSDLGKTKIRRFICTSGSPFIPGSTIKGALRTAIIYDWITTSETGKQKLNSLMDVVEKNIINARKRRVLEEKKRIKGRLDDNEFNEFKQLPNQREVGKKLAEVLNEQMLFGQQRNNTTGFDARHIKISDTDKLSITNLAIAKLKRIKLRDESEVSPFPSEIIKDNSVTSFTFTLVKSFAQKDLTFFNNASIQDFFKIINNFSLASIEYEINAYSSFHNKLKDKVSSEKTDYANVIQFYNELKNIVEKSNNQFAVMRLGSGKTYFDNSIGISLYKKDENAFKLFRELLELGKNPLTKKIVEGRFPTTRTMVESTRLPIGWVIIGLEKNIDSFSTINIYESSANKKEIITISVKENSLKDNQERKVQVATPIKTYILAEITDDKSKPPKVKIIDGDCKDKSTILTGVRLDGLGLLKGSKVLVELQKTKKGILEKAEYKGKAED